MKKAKRRVQRRRRYPGELVEIYRAVSRRLASLLPKRRRRRVKA